MLTVYKSRLYPHVQQTDLSQIVVLKHGDTAQRLEVTHVTRQIITI
ncbi:MAG: hypothetical protein ACP5MT_02040 [Candidatus Acidifodinimicrobium sp.]